MSSLSSPAGAPPLRPGRNPQTPPLVRRVCVGERPPWCPRREGHRKTPSGTRLAPEETAGVREGAEGKGAAFQRMREGYAA